MHSPDSGLSRDGSPGQRRGGARPLVALLACVLVGQTGCAVWQQARTTLISEPSAYSWKWDRKRSLKAYRRWADEAWLAERRGCPGAANDADYALGFRDGFVDYIYAGGNGEPPPVPPRQYWNVALRGAEGKAAASQWFAGYRHGANVARFGGYRENGIAASSYAWGGAVVGDYAAARIMREELGPGQELLPEPAAGYDFRAFEPPTASAPTLPEFTLPPTPNVDAAPELEGGPFAAGTPAPATVGGAPRREFNAPALDEAAQSAPANNRPSADRPIGGQPSGAEPAATAPPAAGPPNVEPDAAPDSIFDLEPPTTRSAPRAPQSPTRAIERFRRAVSPAQFVEPKPTK